MLIDGNFITGDERELFNKKVRSAGFQEALDLYQPTWSPWKTTKWEMFKLKLDWFLVKNLEVQKAELGPYISDHRPIKVVCQF